MCFLHQFVNLLYSFTTYFKLITSKTLLSKHLERRETKLSKKVRQEFEIRKPQITQNLLFMAK